MLKKARVAILVTSIGLMSYGIFRGEMAYVLKKAVAICLECIGVG